MHLKRFVADLDLKAETRYIPAVKEKKGKKVAVVGAGPAGLTAAYYLAIEGYDVDVFEALPVAGGWLAVGIPEYRLPKDVLKAEIKVIEELGVKIHLNTAIGKDIPFEKLRQGLRRRLHRLRDGPLQQARRARRGAPGGRPRGRLPQTDQPGREGLPRRPGRRHRRRERRDGRRPDGRPDRLEGGLHPLPPLPGGDAGRTRGDRGGPRRGDQDGISRGPGPHPRRGREGHGDRVHPDGTGRARRQRPPPPRPGQGFGIHDRLRQHRPGHRPGGGSRLHPEGERHRHQQMEHLRRRSGDLCDERSRASSPAATS